MIVRSAFFSAASIFALVAVSAGHSAEVPPPVADIPENPVANEAPSSPAAASEPLEDELIQGPNWDQLPARSPHWNFELDYVPTTILNDSKHMGRAFRTELGREEPDGYGRRGRFWFFQQDIGRFDLYATTLNYDFFREIPIDRGELLLGGGPMIGIERSSSWNHHYDANFYGVGAQAVAEGFYPLTRFERTDIGVIGYGRVGLLAGVSDDDGSISFGQDSFPIVDELAWGLELRHRYGSRQDKCYYIDVMRQLQDWGRVDLPYAAGLSYQGVAVNFGLGW